MITMFGKTAEEILTALDYYDRYAVKKPVRRIVVHWEYNGIAGETTTKLETWSDRGLTLWVDGKIVYQYAKE